MALTLQIFSSEICIVQIELQVCYYGILERPGHNIHRRRVVIAKLKNLTFTGIVVLIPVLVFAALLVELYEFNLVIVNMLAALAPNETLFDVATANVLALLMIILMCMGVGAAVRVSFISGLFDDLDNAMSRNIPGYAMLKASFTSNFSDDGVDGFIPVVTFNGQEYRIGFEVERSASELVVVYFPGSPNPRNGKICAVPQNNVQRLDIGIKAAMEIFEFAGKGFLEGIESKKSSSTELS